MDNQYREYLISKKWEGYKKAIYYIYKNECYICGSNNGLHVHHKTYDRIYHEDLDDLVLVCYQCHGYIHDKRYTKEEAYEMLINGTYKPKNNFDFAEFNELFSNFEKNEQN